VPFDVFICHASADRDAVARPLAHALEARGLSVWLDEVEIKLGDSLRQKIDEGLRTSTFGVVILSPSFFMKQWTQWELNGLVDREMTTGAKVVLPIWHEVGHDDVAAKSPSLAGKHAARTSDGIEHVADEVAEVLHMADGSEPQIDRVPRTPAEEAALLRRRPDAWEYLLFAALLRRQLDALEPKYRDHELRYAEPVLQSVLDDAEVPAFFDSAFKHVLALLANFNRVMNPEAHERAFGRLGEQGDAARIEHLAGRLIDVYEGLLDWAARMRGTVMPARFERARELVSSFVDRPVLQFREFVDRVVLEIDRVPELLRDGTEPIRIVLTLTLSMEEGLEDEFQRELDRLARTFR
jgi:TIR domain